MQRRPEPGSLVLCVRAVSTPSGDIGELVTSRNRATSGVNFPPPLLYLAGFGVGIAVELAFPIDRPPVVVTVVGP